MAYTTDAARWRALTTRDPNSNGHFIYSIRSTNIYCRPTCPGRLARRANVGFYATAFEAEAAGFRACKRCKPNTVLEDPQKRAVEKACLLIDEALQADEPKSFRLQELARKVNLTPRYFHKIFKDKTGLTPKEYAKRKTTELSSPDTTPVSMTTTDASVQSWDWESFDFNDLVDFGTESSSTLADDFAMGGQAYAMSFGTEVDASSLVHSWDEGYELNGFGSGLVFLDDTLMDPFPTVPLPIDFQGEKVMSSVSTFELDVAALLDCNGLTNILQT
ncbi:hypothetical protein EJ02DRAFT_108184 [Clathrospora elynae]|uniref:HTH araC/xylS-type domain-containing protein n=1 Tax=Clathrospora elynae TaxID=706981 RepID=A0A6A5SW81_9PLEO|nr:hypothetical protein EJ02DRAFT_108184 [Clathrospora elynae]